MQCTKCGKSDKVTVGNRQYCANCGAVFGDATPPTTTTATTSNPPVAVNPPSVPTPATATSAAPIAAAPSNRPTQLTDIARRPTATQPGAAITPPLSPAQSSTNSVAKPKKPSLLGRLFKKTPAPMPTVSVSPTPAAAPPPIAPAPVVASASITAAPGTTVTTPSPAAPSSSVAGVNPAKAFHSAPSSAKPAVLDLRPAATASQGAASITVTPPEDTVTTADSPTISAVTKIVPSAPAKSTNSIAQTKSLTDRRSTAAATPKSQLINKFGSATNPSPTVSATAPAATAVTPAPVEASSSLTQRPRLETPAAAVNNPSNPEVDDNSQSSVAAAVTNVESLQALMPRPLEKTLPAPPSPALLGGIKPTSVAAAAIAIAIMGGYIWVKNYPNYALKVASDQAGFEASLPNYLPGNYSLSGPIAATAGKIALNFSSASDGPLTLQQAKTNWDSGSLLENYVTHKTDKYLAVQNHGLTIYLYNGNQATWINHGIWYTLEGSTHLGRDQVFKIINSL